MNVEISFTIDGNVVYKKFESRGIIVYESQDQETVYVVDKNDGEVVLKMDITCEMSQGCGFVDSIKYQTFGIWD